MVEVDVRPKINDGKTFAKRLMLVANVLWWHTRKNLDEVDENENLSMELENTKNDQPKRLHIKLQAGRLIQKMKSTTQSGRR